MNCKSASLTGMVLAAASAGVYFAPGALGEFRDKQIKWLKGEEESVEQFFSKQSFAYPALSFAVAYAGTSAIAYKHLVKKLSEVEDKKLLNAGKVLAFTATTLFSVGISEIITHASCLSGQSVNSLVRETKKSFIKACEGEWAGFSTIAQTALVLTGIFFISKMILDKGIEKEKLKQK